LSLNKIAIVRNNVEAIRHGHIDCHYNRHDRDDDRSDSRRDDRPVYSLHKERLISAGIRRKPRSLADKRILVYF